MKQLDDVVASITNSCEYETCLRLKKQMASNLELMTLIDHIKELQKDCVHHPEDQERLQRLEEEMTKLEQIPLYAVYMNQLEQVNFMISYVTEELNDYFYQVLNQFSL